MAQLTYPNTPTFTDGYKVTNTDLENLKTDVANSVNAVDSSQISAGAGIVYNAIEQGGAVVRTPTGGASQTIAGSLVVTGDATLGGAGKTVALGDSAITTNYTTKVPNLNADTVDGSHAADLTNPKIPLIEWVNGTTIQVYAHTNFNVVATMDGVKIPNIGYKRVGSNDGSQKTITSSAIMGFGGSGHGALKNNFAYAVFAVANGTAFDVVAVPFVRVYAWTAGTKKLEASTHYNAAAALDYTIGANAFLNSKLVILKAATASAVGAVLNVDAHNSGAFTFFTTDTTASLAQGDWLVLTPAGATNFVYLGSFITDQPSGTGNITQFDWIDNEYTLRTAITYSDVAAVAWGERDLMNSTKASAVCVSPMAREVRGLGKQTVAGYVKVSNVTSDGDSFYTPTVNYTLQWKYPITGTATNKHSIYTQVSGANTVKITGWKE